jgi:hypothetical protein
VAGERLLKLVVPLMVPFDGSKFKPNGKAAGVIKKVVLSGSFTIIHDISITCVVAKI